MSGPRSALLRFFGTSPLFSHFQAQTLARRAAARMQSTAAPELPSQSAFSKFWNSKVGPKTVHFWAPTMKWTLALAGASDFFRPADQLSINTNGALMCTGAIWTRWCFVIKPKNMFLAAANFFLFCVGATQVGRILAYNASTKNESVLDAVKDAAKEDKEDIKALVKDPMGAVKHS